MWTQIGRMMMAGALAAMTLGCSPEQSGPTMVIEEKVYTVTPDAVTVRAGIMTGEVTEMKVIEQVEKDSGKVVSQARLTGTLKLTNSSVDQAVRLVGGKFVFLDARGQPIKVDEKRIDPTVKFATYGASERLDPGQEATQSVDVHFPTEALKAKMLGQIRLELVYLPSPYREEAVNFAVSIGGQ
jgi:hypothetical protein